MGFEPQAYGSGGVRSIVRSSALLGVFSYALSMRSIERRFLNLQQKRPNHSSFLNFAASIRSQNFSADKISRWFSELVEKVDYDKGDRAALLKHLYALSNTPEEHEIETIKPHLLGDKAKA